MLKIVGDINFTDGFFDTGFGVGSSVSKGVNPFEKITRSDSDFWIGNCECVISDKSNKLGVYQKQFVISPSKLSHVEHLDLYNVANNHVMQHGNEAYSDMLAYFEKEDIAYVGAESRKILMFEHQNKKVGILSFSQRDEKYSDDPLYWYNPEYIEVQRELSKLESADFKIAYVHWGNEFIDRPYVDQKKFAHWLVDLGFDLVVGLHAHVLQGYEIYKDKYIYYSVGNFVFNMPYQATKYSVVLTVDLASENAPTVNFEYVFIERDYFPIIVDPSNVPLNFRFEFLNQRLKIEHENELYYDEVFSRLKLYRKSNYKYFLGVLHRFKAEDIKDIISDFIKRRF